MNLVRVLTRDEITRVLFDLRKRARRKQTLQPKINHVLFRLSCCCGLRVKEIAGLNMGDVSVSTGRPSIRVRAEITKGQAGRRRARIVPLWWDAGTLEALKHWKETCEQHGFSSAPDAPFLQAPKTGKRFARKSLQRRWKTAIRVLGDERRQQLSIHTGRHSFCTHALQSGRSMAEVRDAAGHRNIATTGQYLHALESEGARDVFAFADPPPRKKDKDNDCCPVCGQPGITW